MTKRYLGLLIAVGGLLALVPVHKVFAAPFSITTSPVAINLSTKPGGATNTNLQVENNGSSTLQISISLEQFSANGTNGEAKITPIPLGDPVANYVHFSANTLTAPPGQWVPVKMTLNLPPAAQLGYYYAVVFKPLINTITAKSGNVIKGSNAILVLVDTHSSNEQRDLSLASFSSTKKLYDYLPATFNVDVRNKGNIFLAPTGDIFISKSLNFNSPLADLPINTGQGNVLPDSIRNFQATWSKGFPVYVPKTIDNQPVLNKNSEPVQQLEWDFSKLSQLRFGKYYAHLALVYNDGHRDVPIDATISFWVVPLKPIIIFVLILIILVVASLLLFKRYKKRIIEKARLNWENTQKSKAA